MIRTIKKGHRKERAVIRGLWKALQRRSGRRKEGRPNKTERRAKAAAEKQDNAASIQGPFGGSAGLTLGWESLKILLQQSEHACY